MPVARFIFIDCLSNDWLFFSTTIGGLITDYWEIG